MPPIASPITSLILPALASCISTTFEESALKTASTITTSIVYAKLDYCNCLFLKTDITQINCLQAIQNALAHAVTKTPKHHQITLVLKKLHWLKIPERIITCLNRIQSNITHL